MQEIARQPDATRQGDDEHLSVRAGTNQATKRVGAREGSAVRCSKCRIGTQSSGHKTSGSATTLPSSPKSDAILKQVQQEQAKSKEGADSFRVSVPVRSPFSMTWQASLPHMLPNPQEISAPSSNTSAAFNPQFSVAPNQRLNRAVANIKRRRPTCGIQRGLVHMSISPDRP